MKWPGVGIGALMPSTWRKSIVPPTFCNFFHRRGELGQCIRIYVHSKSSRSKDYIEFYGIRFQEYHDFKLIYWSKGKERSPLSVNTHMIWVDELIWFEYSSETWSGTFKINQHQYTVRYHTYKKKRVTEKASFYCKNMRGLHNWDQNCSLSLHVKPCRCFLSVSVDVVSP